MQKIYYFMKTIYKNGAFKTKQQRRMHIAHCAAVYLCLGFKLVKTVRL